ncbi:MAG: hypothetical protein WBP72_12780 [Rhodocyclaceae bacterium]
MIFALITFASALALESLGTWISIIGLSGLFSTNPIIIALAAALDVGKVVTVSFLYKKWTTAPALLKVYMGLASIVLMAITSVGAFGYLSGAFQGAIQDTKQHEVLVTSMTQERGRLEARKKEIDAQIANLPSNNVRGRQRLIRSFKAEADKVNARLETLDAELPKLQVQQIATNTHTGPIVYVAQAFHVSLEDAAKYVILIIIVVFDPLAIALLVAGNFLWETRPRRTRPETQAALSAQMPLELPRMRIDEPVDTTGSAALPEPAPMALEPPGAPEEAANDTIAAREPQALEAPPREGADAGTEGEPEPPAEPRLVESIEPPEPEPAPPEPAPILAEPVVEPLPVPRMEELRVRPRGLDQVVR